MDVVATAAVNRGAIRNADQIAALNARYTPMDFAQRIQQMYREFDVDKVLVTSSFAATSAYFLHLISTLEPRQKFAFIDTGYHFPETLAYRDYLIERFNLNVFSVRAEGWKHQFSIDDKTYERDPDFCCAINKLEPLDAIKPNYDVWVSSLMRSDTEHRAQLDIFEARGGILKFNPMLDVTHAERDAYIRKHDLPFHPLVAKGYHSIGCVHCTVPGEGRSGRWIGKPKTECGLHR